MDWFKRLPQLPKSIITVLIGILCLDLMVVTVKFLGARYSVPQLAFYRDVFGLIACFILLYFSSAWKEQGRPLKMRQWKLGLTRGLMVFFARICFFFAVINLELATATTLAFASPLFITALAIPVLGDKVGRWRWAAVALGFAGIVWVMKPGSDVFSWWALLPLGAALGYSAASVFVKKLDDDVPNALVSLYAHIGSCTCAGVYLLWSQEYTTVQSSIDWIMIAATGLFAAPGVFLLTVAYRSSPASMLAPFEYFAIIYSFAFGWYFFNEAPLDRLFPGVLLIVAAGMLILWRENVNNRAK